MNKSAQVDAFRAVSRKYSDTSIQMHEAIARKAGNRKTILVPSPGLQSAKTLSPKDSMPVSGDVKESRQQVIDFAKKRDLGFSILFGEAIPALYGVYSFPNSVFVNRDGKVRFEVSGSGPEALKSMEIALNELLK